MLPFKVSSPVVRVPAMPAVLSRRRLMARGVQLLQKSIWDKEMTKKIFST
jgi:hypothetical protein